MTKQIFRSIFIAAFSVFLCSVLLFLAVLYHHFSEIQFHQLKIQTELAAQGIQWNGLEYLESLYIEDSRITWIDPDGHVLYDNAVNAENLENHFQREEFKVALENGYGQSIRYSSTLTQKLLYSAKRLHDGSVLRLSAAQSTLITLIFKMLQPLLILFFIAFLLSLFLASRLSKEISQSLNDLNLEDPTSNAKYQELSLLLKRIEAQQCEIKRQKNDLLQKESELSNLIACISEGIVLLNKNGKILNINSAAVNFLDTDLSCIGKNIRSVDQSISWKELLQESNKNISFKAYLNKGIKKYLLIANPVFSKQEVSKIILIIMIDITEKSMNHLF